MLALWRRRSMTDAPTCNAKQLAGLALRVPVADVSVVDLTVALERPASLDAVKAAVKHAAEGAMEGVVGYEEEPKASSDFVGDARSCVFDA